MDEDVSGFTGPAAPYGISGISDFTLIHTSGDGFFEMYRGERAGQFRAYKCLKPQWRGSALHEAMLKKEFELGYPLRHPNICETIQYTSIDGLGNCIEMEWIDGEPLDCFLEHGLPDDREFLRMAGELCDALSYLHSRQMIHRDLKPSNIMVTHSGHVIKLIDFGLSDSSTYSILKAPAGTRGFIAPEVLAGSAADVRSDIWSLGMVLRRMNGRHKNVISKCLHKNPQKRYRSAGAVREALCRRPLWPALAALVAVAAAAFIYIPSRKESPQESTERLAPDTIVVIMQPPKDTITRTVPPPRKPSAADESKDSQLDRIFQQASELLEEKI